MRFLTLTIATLFLYSGAVFGQNADSLQIEELISKAKSFVVEKRDSAFYYLDTAENLSIHGNFKDLQAVSYYTKGRTFEHYNENDSAEYWLLKWLEIRETQSPEKQRWAWVDQ